MTTAASNTHPERRRPKALSHFHEITWIDLPSVRDSRGVLTAVEAERDVPFSIRRVFLIHHATADRGGHAHMDTDQVVTAAAGSLTVEVSDGTENRSFRLNDPTRGVYVPRMVFVRLKSFSKGAVCLVLASTHYDISRSFRTWEDYRRAVEIAS